MHELMDVFEQSMLDDVSAQAIGALDEERKADDEDHGCR